MHIVAHPRKNIGFLRKEDISGTADLTNAVDNVIICHRNNRDYERAVAEFYGKEMILQLTAASNYLEVAQTSVSTSSTGPVKVGRVGVSKTTWTLDQINEFEFVGFPVGDSGEYRVLTVDGRPAQNDVLA